MIISVLISLPAPVLQRQEKNRKTLGAFKNLLPRSVVLKELNSWNFQLCPLCTHGIQGKAMRTASLFPLLSPVPFFIPAACMNNSEAVVSLASVEQVIVREGGWAFSCCSWLGAPESGVEQLGGYK